MKSGYSIAVDGTSKVIVPDQTLRAEDGVAWAAGAVSQGDYVASGGFLYWAVNAGTSVTAPIHKRGVDTVDSIEWLVIAPTRNVMISSDPLVSVSAAKGTTAILAEDVTLDAYRPMWELGNHAGPIAAITDGTAATIGISYN